ncbi:hypothetical protein FF100_36540 [Methylobacterium terricola]|uniref:Uncharacterized protein n=1 Tax=Methylobacterium terricola TaxID=2583531 RepID=A0A5C4L5N7_9HYPH|nr:hypothetical protein [Methylobacterium terricola]TNC04557.1 hypothetical protein FF100_36540 [Methylobacterium terricola]
MLDATRPIILNGIPALTDRADLGSRTLTVRLAPISEEARQTEDEIEALWEAAQPRVLAALFTALSAAVRNIGRTRLPGLPRLADLTEWVTAAAPGLGWEPGEFVSLITTAAREAANSAFEASPVAIAIKGLALDKKLWSGTATDLLPLLRDRVDPAILKLRIWPETNQALGNAIDRVIPLLKGQGVTVERRHSGKRTITIALAAGAE